MTHPARHPILELFCQRCDSPFRTATLRSLCDPCLTAALRHDQRPRALGREMARRARDFGREFGQALAEAMTEEATV